MVSGSMYDACFQVSRERTIGECALVGLIASLCDKNNVICFSRSVVLQQQSRVPVCLHRSDKQTRILLRYVV